MPLVLTVDVEDWLQSTVDTSLPIAERALRNTERLLDLLSEKNRKVTCFVLGKFAAKYPGCVRRIAEEGHEVASHGYGHDPVTTQSPEEFREDVRRSKGALEDLTGKEVAGYRAPRFSIVRDTIWALDILADEGFSYDSSIHPVLARYGIPDWPPQPVRVDGSSGRRLVELPAATFAGFGRRWPVAGGGYHRLLPWPLIRHAIGGTLSRGEVFVAYCHPYEFDPDEFVHVGYPLSLKMRLHQGLGRRGFEAKFRRMLDAFESTLAGSLARQREWPRYAGAGRPAGSGLTVSGEAAAARDAHG